jgi:PAS domain S-box-containing protein
VVLLAGLGAAGLPWLNAVAHGTPDSFAPVLTLIMGSILSLLVFRWIRILLADQQRAVAVAGAKDSFRHDTGERFRLITDNLPELIILTDAIGRRLYTSASHQRLLGYPVAQLEHAPLSAHVHPEDRPRLLEASEKALGGSVTVLALRLAAQDGSWRTLESRVGSIADDLGQVRLLIVSHLIA